MAENIALVAAPMMQAPLIESLDSMPDEALRELIERARGVLAVRESERRKQVLAQIRRLAQEYGLQVEIARPKRPRGRPPKRKEATDAQ